jgi:hypothetical protein
MNFAVSFGLLFVLIVLPVLVSGCLPDGRGGVPWYEARRDPTGLAPDPASAPEAVIQVYAARAVSWRGAFAVHTWLALKPTGAERYTRYEVLGFGVANGAPALRVDRMGPDNYWFGARPQILLDRRGTRRRRNDRRDPCRGCPLSLSARVPRLARSQQQHVHRLYCPRSPELGLNLPSNAVGKDFLPGSAFFAAAPSGSGFQVSLYGLAGLLLAIDEGFELNFLGLNIGVDAAVPALKLPGIGRLGLQR